MNKEPAGMSDDLDGDILAPNRKKDEPETVSNPWDNEEAEKDRFSGRDQEQGRELYNLSIPNNEVFDDGSDNPGYHRLCLDKKQTIPPSDLIRSVVLARLRPNIAQLPYNESKGMPAYEKMIGYSFDGISPTPDSTGKYMDQCCGPDETPFACCSIAPDWDGGEPTPTALLTTERTVTPKDFDYLKKGSKIKTKGECPWGRWGNGMIDKDLKKFNMRATAKPTCIENIIFLHYHLDLGIYFNSYWKVMSKKSADAFITSFKLGNKEQPLRRYIAEITVKAESTYVVPFIQNTREEADYALIKPVWDYFQENQDKFIRNTALVMEELRQKDIDAVNFEKPEESDAKQ
jgi:hypothetical protein